MSVERGEAHARSLGFHDTTTARIAAEAGKSWIHYAPGDHTR
ncbi:hypothetical protein [Actinomadura violacea]|nr:hypothetical protein [Actinomadura violacea]